GSRRPRRTRRSVTRRGQTDRTPGRGRCAGRACSRARSRQNAWTVSPGPPRGPRRGGVGYAAMGLRQRFRYRFDNLMSRGVGAQILLLAILSAVLVLITAAAIEVAGVVPTGDNGPDSFGRVTWRSLMHTLDPGTLGGDTAGWTFLFIMLFVTI